VNAKDCVIQIEQELSSHDLFYGHGTDNSWSEAQWLVTSVLTADGVEKITELTDISPSQKLRIDELLEKRISEKVPLAYLLQEAWFAGYCFYVDERVLVPRSPIAELINHGFEPLLEETPATILDLCCGSGCIGLACALAFPESQVILADISPQALAVAEINIKRFGLEHRVSVRHSDLYQQISEDFDLIVSNPPYVPQDEYLALPDEYHAEPALGLVSEQEGLGIPVQILEKTASHLRDKGLLILETGYTWPDLEKSLPQVPFLWLDFEYGGEGVAAINCAQLRKYFQNKN
jgi:ribosomal protein L3 glutamine methyltransferase